MNDELPELLWAALLVTTMPRSEALAKFREIAAIAREYPDACRGLNHSDLALSEKDFFDRVVASVLGHALGYIALRPLLLFAKLPGYKRWAQKLDVEPYPTDWGKIQKAILLTLNHQSQEATDCRWLSPLFLIAVGRLYFSHEQKETAEEILFYPKKGDMTKVRPIIRAAEGVFRDKIKAKSPWAEDFWRACYANTPCLRLDSPIKTANEENGISPRELETIGIELDKHFFKTLSSTAVDAKHDACFGFAKYSLNILSELLPHENGRAILGRFALRAVVEAYITFAYLIKKGDAQIWSTYRNYGSGQAKLAFLKLEESTTCLPSYVDKEILEYLSNEDAFQEFISINLGNWDKTDLREMSMFAGCKDIYDIYYAWTSAYSHSNWASLRDSGFETCLNPLTSPPSMHQPLSEFSDHKGLWSRRPVA